MSLGLVNFDFRRNWWAGQWLRLAIGVPVLLVYAYVAMPPLVFPQAISLLLLTLVPNAVFSTLVAARAAIAARRVVSIRPPSILPYAIAVLAVGAFAGALAVAPILDASGLRDVPVGRLLEGCAAQRRPAPPAHRPEESAIFAGEKVIGQLGTYYRVGNYNIQVERGRLVWVAPLEFQDSCSG